jgi:hypothetical protein
MAKIIESVIEFAVFTFCWPTYCCQFDCVDFVSQSRKLDLLNEYKSIFVMDIDLLVTVDNRTRRKEVLIPPPFVTGKFRNKVNVSLCLTN